MDYETIKNNKIEVIGKGDMDTIKTRQLIKQLGNGEDVLFEDDKTLDQIIQEIADEEGMTFEETMAKFRKGLKDANGMLKPVDHKAKAKKKAKKKQAKASKKRNRK